MSRIRKIPVGDQAFNMAEFFLKKTGRNYGIESP